MQNALLIASGNPGKILEIKAILEECDLNIQSAADLVLSLSVNETGSSYIENARLKAVAYQAATGMAVLADDSGLEVDALNGAPGIYSARYSPKANATDADRRKYLLKQLQDKPRPWTAHFHCSAVLIKPEGGLIETSGQCNGEIIPEERGTGGFGYDPIFFIPEEHATMAEIPASLKNRISHRAKALLAMLPELIKL